MPHIEEVKMIYSGMLPYKGGKIVSVTFERGTDTAEGIVPDCVIRSHSGFTEEETEKLKKYLSDNKDSIIKEAEKISGLKHVFEKK